MYKVVIKRFILLLKIIVVDGEVLGEGDVGEVGNYFLQSPSQRRASPGCLLLGGEAWLGEEGEVRHVISS